MVDLIIYPNPRINKELLMESIKRYNSRTDKPVNIRILKSDITTDPNNEDKDILELYLEIRNSTFKCKAYKMDDGKLNKNKTVWVNASFETVKICYTLKKEDNSSKYRVERNDPLFNLLNYGLQQRDRVTRGNNQGFNLSYSEITNTLDNLNFGAVVKPRYGKNVILAMDMDKMEEISIRKIK